MADETFEIGFEVTGDGSAKKSFEDLKIAELGAKDEARKLAQQLRELRTSEAATEAQTEETARAYVRAQETARQYGAEARRLTSASRTQASAASAQAASMARAQNTLGTALTASGRKWGEVAGAMGNVGSVFSTLNPAMGQAGSLMGAVGSASSALTGALGPVGVAMAVVTTAAGVLIPMLADTNSELDESARSAENAAERYRQLGEEMNEAAGRTAARRGLRGTAALEAEIEALRTERLGAEQTMERLQNRVEHGSPREAAAARRELQRVVRDRDDLQRRLDEAERVLPGSRLADAGEAALDAGIQEGLEAARGSRRGGGNAAATAARQAAAEAERLREQGEEALARLAQAAKDHDLEMVQSRRDALEAQQEAEIAYLERMDAIRREADEQEARRQEELAANAARRQLERFNADLNARQAAFRDQAEQARELEVTALEGVLDLTVDATSKMIKFVAEGGELGSEAFIAMLDSYLEATSVEYSIKAIAEVANAAIAAARQDYAGAAQHGVAAGLAAGVAAATGIAGAAISVPTAGGGAGGAPAPVSQDGGAAGGGGPTIINLYAPQAVFTEAERGALIDHASREFRRAGGRSRT